MFSHSIFPKPHEPIFHFIYAKFRDICGEYLVLFLFLSCVASGLELFEIGHDLFRLPFIASIDFHDFSFR
jgi:hypothetical protein